MARCLAIDWDHGNLRLVEAAIGGGTARVQRAAAWSGLESPILERAEGLGKLLRNLLKEARIAPAPVLIAVGRDRVILKDVRYPSVPETEEPAVVRFQAIKELADAPDEAVIDYHPIGEREGERHAHVLVVKRSVVEAYHAICKSAGLRLAGVSPRAFGLAACMQRLAGASVLTPALEPPDAPAAVLAVGEGWAEFTISRSGKLVFTRALGQGDGLIAEVRRNLALYNGQSPRDPVQAVYVAGLGEHAALRERLQEVLGIPVHALDPFGGVERPELPSEKRGAFIGAVGLLYAQSSREGLAINFAQPKQPKPPKDPNRNRRIYAAALAALAVVVGVGFCYAKLADAGREVAARQMDVDNLDRQLKDLDETDKRIKAIGAWTDSGMVWLDELYDLTDRIVDPNKLRITELIVEPIARTGKEKDANKAVAKITIKGVAKTKNDVDALADAFTRDGHYHVGPKTAPANEGSDKAEFPLQFTLANVEVEKLPPMEYTRSLRSFGRGR